MLPLSLFLIGLLYLSRGVPILRGRIGLKRVGDHPETLWAIGLTLTLLGLILAGGAVVLVLAGRPGLS